MKKRNEQFFETNYEETTYKKHPSIYGFSIFDFFATKSPFKEGDGEQQKFVDNLCLLVVKKNLPIQFVEKAMYASMPSIIVPITKCFLK